MKRKKKKQTVNVELTPENMPLEALIELIESGVIQDEIPFSVLAEHYSELLDDWYPGFPGAPREMTKNDPIRCRGRVENGLLELPNISGGEKIPFDGEHCPPEGEHDLFLQQDDQGGWFIYFTAEVQVQYT